MSKTPHMVPSVDIIAVQKKADVQTFLDFPYDIYRDDPAWYPPLRFERKDHLSAHKKPVAQAENRQLFLAKKDGQCVGRIAAFINASHQAYYHDNAGHFGFFDCEAVPEIGRALLSAAEKWLQAQGAKKMIGPSNDIISAECGLLINGFEHPPVLMMPFGRSDYQDMVEAHGLSKAIDMYAFWADLHAGYPRPKMTTMMVNYADRTPSLTFRTMRRGHFKDEVRLAMDIFNDAWSENWGFVPFSDEQISHMAAELRPLIFRGGFQVGMIDGEPAGFIWMIPNLNEAIRDLDGRLLPFGWAKLIGRLKISGVKTARIPLMGLRKEYQNTRKGLAVVAKLCESVFAVGRERGYTHCELSWILENNPGMISICEQASAVPYKTYRMYEKSI